MEDIKLMVTVSNVTGVPQIIVDGRDVSDKVVFVNYGFQTATQEGQGKQSFIVRYINDNGVIETVGQEM